MLIPMAVSLGFGVILATAITLILVPAYSLILDDATRLLERLRGHRGDTRTDPASVPAQG
jgi:hypothetical protein